MRNFWSVLVSRLYKYRYIVLSILLLIILYIIIYILPIFGLYALESSAIKYSYPNEGGTVVFEKKIEDKKVIILKTESNIYYVKSLERNCGIFYCLVVVDRIDKQTEDNKMMFAWTASRDKGSLYDTIFAIITLDKDIQKIVVSNEDTPSTVPLEEVKENSTVYFVMDVKNGYSAHYSYLNSVDVTDFTFRGLNSDGEVVSIN
ncbi:hypothetical protein [Chengkuizengella marina]|uniref:Uncharacterized protein n=1 Tax=Chengkuizengella marina TaxID=2507566 RepID=A0A6N9PYP1_9BACL|nr:hypothetical protein [Chengkuizengella marina]NBI28639.1 hypothetical protein [Chengkuizengella marina]